MTVLAALYLAPQAEPLELPTKRLALSGLQSLHGKPMSLKIPPKGYLVLIYLGVECPIANRYAPEINRITADYAKKGVQFIRVYVEPTSYRPSIIQHGKDYGYNTLAVLDTDKRALRELGVRVTPETVVVDSGWKMRYRGRIDNRNVEHGKERTDYRRDLRIALDELLAGKPVSVPATAATGCYIGMGGS